MQLPVRFGKYELLEFLGGGMSRVYKARDTVLTRQVAVKILTAEGIADPDTRARFLQEAKVSAGLVHDNVIRIFDYGEEQGWPFIVMEFLTGSDLKHAIRNQKAGDTANKLRIGIEGARALEYVHSQKLIHRDIKPDNLHIDGNGRVRLMDFGIAKTEDMSLTKTGFQVGTPFYMAPEQVNGEKATERTDVYAYGMVLYELFTGVRAIQGDTIQTIFAAILNQPVNLERLRTSDAPPALADLIRRMTAKDPMQRPAGFGEVIAALEGIARGLQAPAATPGAPPGGISGRKLVVGLVAAALVLTAVVSWLVIQNRQKMAGVRSADVKLEETRQTETGEMRLVPGGSFVYGGQKMQAALPAFYIDRTEVSNAVYRKFGEATGRALPRGLESAQPDWPVVNVTIIEAKDFCSWADKRLPLPLEWEKAGRGTDGRVFPWGDAEDPSKANVADNEMLGGKTPMPVDSMHESASAYGVLHLSGNVWEWVDEARQPSEEAIDAFAGILTPPPTGQEPWYIAKGGSFDRPVSHSVLYEFMTLPARFSEANIGFRCVWMPKP